MSIYTRFLLHLSRQAYDRIVAQYQFRSAEALAIGLSHYLQLYNHHIPQRALGHISPIQALKNWAEKEPERFNKKVYNLSGLDKIEVPKHYQSA